MKLLRSLKSILWFVLLATALSTAQVSPGLPAYSTFDSHEVDSVNLMNNNVIIHVPVRSKNELMPFSFSLAGNYYMTTYGNAWAAGSAQELTGGDRASAVLAEYANGFLTTVDPARFTTTTTVNCPVSGTTSKYSGWAVITADQTAHPLPTTVFSDKTSAGTSCLTGSGFTAQTIDGSGLTVTVSPNGTTASSIYDRSGTSLSAGLIKDTNANQVSLSGGIYNDATGNVVTITGTFPNNTFKWADVNLGSPSVQVSTTSLSIGTHFACATYDDFLNTLATSMPTNFSFPDGTSLGLVYEQTPGYSAYVTGRLGTINLRTGGAVNYGYSGGGNNAGLDCQYQTVPVLTRTLASGEQTKYTLAYSIIGSGPNYKAVNTVVYPGGNTAQYQFTGFTSTGASRTYAQVLTQVKKFQGPSTLLETLVYCYNTFANCSPSAAPTAQTVLPITSTVVFRQLAGSTTWSATEEHYDVYGNTVYSASYDFGASTPQFVTTITYGTWGGSSCSAIGNHVNDKPCDVVTKNASQNIVSESRGKYDTKGNLLTKWDLTAPSTFLSATYGYTSQGALASYTSETGVTGSVIYGNCGGNFPTQTTIGGVVTHDVWICDGGVRDTHTDANGFVTTYGYADINGNADPYWRLTSVRTPLQETYWTIYSPNSVEETFSFNQSNVNVVQDMIRTIDGYGRAVRVQTKQGTAYKTVTTKYNPTANTKSVSVPCSVPLGSDCTTGFTTTTIDGDGRESSVTDGAGATVSNVFAASTTEARVTSTLSPAPSGENVKVSVRSVDGFGRPTSDCSILSGSATACGHGSSGNGILSTYVYSSTWSSLTTSATRGSETRTVTDDALHRPIRLVHPESGTDTYTYDSYGPGACGITSAPGKLMLIQRANGTAECFAYVDALKRLSDFGAGTDCRRFRYDSSSNGVQPAPTGYPSSPFAAGRLVEAETDTCAWPPTSASMITDEWFAYDTLGHLTSVWEATPNSGGYYYTVATFASNGALVGISGIPGYAGGVAYGLDTDGNPSTAMFGTIPLVSGVTYGPVGPTAISIGSGTDEDDYTYKATTGKMATYQFFVGAANTKGTLTWDTNGTLGTLAIVDGFNAGGSHTCNFAYDDVERLVTDSCGTPWSQTFSYDQYNNLTKAGSSAFNPGYADSKNQYSGIGAAYDASGNIQWDGSVHYTWDGYGKLASVGTSVPVCGTSGTCITYDAFGRAVEKSVGSTYTEILYSAVGKLAVMSGATTVNSAYLPMPGGGTVYCTGAGCGTKNYWHKDWLGTVRVASTVQNSAVTFDRAFAPYGEQYLNFGSTTTPNFTGDTQDLYAGLYDTPNRELSFQSRWLNPDPAGSGWNAYAYPTNPNSATDPTGLYAWFDAEGGPHDNAIGSAGGCASMACSGFSGYTGDPEDTSLAWIGGLSVYGPTVTDNGGQPISDGVWNGEPFMPSGVTGGLQYTGSASDSGAAAVRTAVVDSLEEGAVWLQNHACSNGPTACVGPNGIAEGGFISDGFTFKVDVFESLSSTDSFFNVKGTRGNFQPVDAPTTLPDRISVNELNPGAGNFNWNRVYTIKGEPLYSHYWRAEGGMIRASNHAGSLGASNWSLEGLATPNEFRMFYGDMPAGFINYDDLGPMLK